MKNPPIKNYFLILIVLIGLFAASVMAYSTKNNPWGFTDAIAYLVSARNLLSGPGLGYHNPDGTFHFLTHYPPFYPLILAGLGIFGTPIIDVARWLDVFLFPATLIFTALIFYWFSRKPSLGIAVALMVFAFEPMLRMSASAMSEPLFIFLSVGTGLCLLLFLRDGMYRWLILAALLASASALTRYIGVVWIATGVFSLLLFSRAEWKVRARVAVVYLFVSILPVVIWFAWVYLSADNSVGGRAISFDIVGLFERLEPFRGLVISVIWKWLPGQFALDHVRYIWRVLALFGLVIVALIASFIGFRRIPSGEKQVSDFHVFSVFGLYTIFYGLLLAVIYAFSTPTPDIDDRMLLPFFVGAAIAFYAGVALWLDAFFTKRWLVLIPWLLVLVCILEYSPENYQSVHQRPDYAGLLSVYWQESPVVATVRDLPPEIKLISNQPEVLLMWADRPAYYFGNFNQEFIEAETFYGSDDSDPVQHVFREGAALVVTNDFYPATSNLEGMTSQRQVQLFRGLNIYQQFEGGTIYFYP